MKKLLAILCAFSFSLSMPKAHAQPVTNLIHQRSSGWQSLTLSSGTPSTNPNPEAQANPVKQVTTGTSSNGVANVVVLHLKACANYYINLCATTGNTLSGGGTLQIWDFPDYSLNSAPVWTRNKQLDETVTATTQCQSFAGHVANGTDWIGVSTSSVTVSAGTTALVKVDATCAY